MQISLLGMIDHDLGKPSHRFQSMFIETLGAIMSTAVVNGASHVVMVAHADAVAKLIDCAATAL